MTMFRQGDLLIRLVDKLPKGLVPKHGNIVLEGEMTGHNHEITSGQVLEVPTAKPRTESAQDLIFAFLNVPQGAELTHPEHGPIKLDPGVYEVRRQMEAVGSGLRLVAD